MMSVPRGTLCLIADDDRDHVAFIMEQLSASPLKPCVHVDTPAEAAMYLESMAVHNPSGRPLPCVLLLAFTEDSLKYEALEWSACHPAARPQRIVVLRSLHDFEREHYLALGADEAISRYPRAADLAAASAPLDPVAPR
jgi:hypothetical protein